MKDILIDVIKTAVVTVIILIITVIAMAISSDKKHDIVVKEYNKLDLTDPTIQILKDRIIGDDYFRSANVSISNLSDEVLIKYAFTLITKDDYSMKVIEPEKIRCEINENLFFISGSTCNFRVIKNSTLDNYIKQQFNLDRELSYNDLEYIGYTCKNDGNNYYCLYEPYTKNDTSYSVLKEAYEDGDKVYVREYYLYIDFSDQERCMKYLDKNYCVNHDILEKPSIDEDVIISDGVLYEHVYTRVDNTLYFEKSYILNER